MRLWVRKVKEPTVVLAVVPEPTPSATLSSRLGSSFRVLWRGLKRLLEGVDRACVLFAIPFGVLVADPRRRYSLLLGTFSFLFLVGSLPLPLLPLVALGLAYLGVLAIGRAWVVNEQERTAIVKKLHHGDPDQMPDLRWTALLSALQLLILFPLLFQQAQRHLHLYRVHGPTTFGSWLWFSLDQTYLKALPDWSILYGIHISSIQVDQPWGRHLVFLSRLTFDYILIQGFLRLLAIRSTIREAVAAVKSDPERVVRLGKRAIPPLIEQLKDPDKGVRGAAANALMQLRDQRAIQPLVEALQEE